MSEMIEKLSSFGRSYFRCSSNIKVYKKIIFGVFVFLGLMVTSCVLKSCSSQRPL